MIGVSPTNDQLVDAAPGEVALTFTEQVALAGDGTRVLNDAAEVVSGPATVEGERIVIPLDPGIPDGTYTVSFSVISADSHPIGGVSVFHVGERTSAGLVDVESGGTVSTPLRVGVTALTAVGYAGTLVACGLLVTGNRRRSPLDGDSLESGRVVDGDPLDAGDGAAMATLRTRWERLIVRSAVLAAVCLYASVPFRIARLGGGMEALRDNELFVDLLTGPIGWSTGITTLGLFTVGVITERWGAVTAAYPAALVALAGFAVEGHTRGKEPRLLMIVSDVVHTAAAAVWVGGIVAVVLALRAAIPDRRAAEIVRRFSTAAVVAVVSVTVAGTVMAWRILDPDYDGIVTTGWGWALVVKVALVGVVVALGAWNRSRLVGRVELGHRRTLGWIVVAELVVFTAIVGVTAVLVTRSPVTTAAPAPQPLITEVMLAPDGGTATVSVTPARVGTATIDVEVRDVEGRIVNPVAAPTVELSLAEPEIGPLTVALTPLAIGEYQGTTTLAYAGEWTLVVRVRIDDFTSVAGEAVVEVDG